MAIERVDSDKNEVTQAAKKSAQKKTTKKSSKKATKKTAKKAAKKTTKKTSPEKKPAAPAKQRSQWRDIIIAAALVIVVVLLIAVFSSLDAQNSARNDVIVATVNGDPVFLSDVEGAYNALDPFSKMQFTKESMRDQLVDKALVLQEAERAGITVSESEVQERIDEQLASLQISEGLLRDTLATANVTWEEYTTAVREEVSLTKFVEQVILEGVTVSEQEVSSRYNENLASYQSPEGKARIRHILVETEEEATDVLAQYNAGGDFAQLAGQYSIGPTGPNGGSLGFVGADDPLVPEFLEAALVLGEGQVSDPVQTQFGWHIILRDSDNIPLSEVRFSLQEQMKLEKGQVVFQELLAELRASADLSYFNEDKLVMTEEDLPFEISATPPEEELVSPAEG